MAPVQHRLADLISVKEALEAGRFQMLNEPLHATLMEVQRAIEELELLSTDATQ